MYNTDMLNLMIIIAVSYSIIWAKLHAFITHFSRNDVGKTLIKALPINARLLTLCWCWRQNVASNHLPYNPACGGRLYGHATRNDDSDGTSCKKWRQWKTYRQKEQKLQCRKEAQNISVRCGAGGSWQCGDFSHTRAHCKEASVAWHVKKTKN